jgi:hypothetical protein
MTINPNSDKLVWKQTVRHEELALWVEVVPWGTMSRLESRSQVWYTNVMSQRGHEGDTEV